MTTRVLTLSDLAADVARSLVRVSTVGQTARLSTPLVYPGGGMVGVELSRLRDQFLVTDSGSAHREAGLLGGERAFVRLAREVAERFGVRFDNDMIFDMNVAEGDLVAAVIAVANAAKTAVETTALHLASTPHADHRAALWDRLERIYNTRSVEKRKRVRGSTDVWEFDAVVEHGGKLSLFEVVPPHPISVSSAVTKFLDVRDLGETAPNRVAVLVRKAETPHLSLLARTARVVSATDPDDVFRRAA